MVGTVSQVTGMFSSPAARNPQTGMMRAAYAGLGYRVEYLNLEVSSLRLGDAVAGARAMGWLGFAVGEPHKRAVVPHLDGLAESAAMIGSATCAARRGDAMIGENTEGWAVLESIEEFMDPEGARAVVFGAGAAGRAVSVELARAGVRAITIVNRSRSRAARLAGLLTNIGVDSVGVVEWSDTFRIPALTDIVVNATPVGGTKEGEESLNLDMDSLSSRMLVADMVLNPHDTQLLKEASALGCDVIDGIEVLVNQGALAIRLWTNADADTDTMREALIPALGALAR
ncbi:MAG: shikimate dehydrogenase [Actinobacteria bacterium]|nr:shikimate dehydrogenase [Actinomycetota bacterium]